MVYFDDSGNRIYRRIRRRIPPAEGGPDDAKTRYIRQVAEDNPGSTPDEVYAEIYYVRRRHDIPRDMVRKVLAKPRPKRSLWPFGR
ncbi:hypothetical protein [Streptomyces hyaluromycini]|uniref:hypothetical protein n=1 Tax=Streptomyces hyaluromycini TaxID=1377993 RepID=UPI0011AE9D6C|nr:hypothetical protein [Streptomyces hyaluromycini]